MHHGGSRAKTLQSFLFTAFFISGGCGLVYEVLWGKYLSLFVGSTTYGHMMVLATFMAGLAAGSFYFGRKVDLIERPLKFYGWMEVGIGLYGVLYPMVLDQIKDFYFHVAGRFPFGDWVPLVAKLALAFGLLFLPTFLMGGTLPILGKFVIRSLGRVGNRIAFLYFINGCGAVFGTLLAGFYMIEHMGLQLAMVVTGLVNILVGFAVLLGDWLLERKGKEAEAVEDSYAAAEPIVTYAPRLVLLAGLAIFLSGFTSMIYELVWIRLFAVVLGSSTYSFSLMLAAFISGIALGSLVATELTWRTRRYLFVLGLAELGIALAVLIGLPLYERLPFISWKLRYLLRPVPETFVYYHAIKFGLCFTIMFLPTLFFGITLPLVSKIVSTDLKVLGRRVGGVYSANTLGTLLGALATGLLLIPKLGLQRSLEVAIIANLVIGALVIVWSGEATGTLRRWIPALAGVSGLAFYFIAVPAWNPVNFSWGQFRFRSAPPATYAEFRKLMEAAAVLYYKEDFNCNIAVLEMKLPNGQSNLTLTVNGKPDASSTSDMPTQVLVGQIPLLFHPQVEDVLVVGLGSGVTAGSVLAHPVRQVDTVEISPAVSQAVPFFKAFNNDVLHNPRFRLIIEDAKTFMRLCPKLYDVVINEPSNPWVAGVGNLFSVEFFEDAVRRLKPGGLMVQWFHTYEMTNDITAMVVKTMNVVFPYIYIFQGSSKDIILLGSLTPLQPNYDALAAKLAMPAVRQQMERIGVMDLPTLLALQILSPSRIHEITMESEVNRDDRPLLEYRAPRAFYVGGSVQLIQRSDQRFSTRNDLFLSYYMKDHPLTPDSYRHLLQFFRNEWTGNDQLAFSIGDRLAEMSGGDADASRVLANLNFMRGRQERALSQLQQALNMQGPNLPVMEQYADLQFGYQIPLDSMFNKQDLGVTLRYLQQCLEISANKDHYLIKLAQTYQAMELYGKALPLLLQAESFRKQMPVGGRAAGLSNDHLWSFIGKMYYRLADYERAQLYFQKCIEANPRHSEAAYFMLVLRDLMKSMSRKQTAAVGVMP